MGAPDPGERRRAGVPHPVAQPQERLVGIDRELAMEFVGEERDPRRPRSAWCRPRERTPSWSTRRSTARRGRATAASRPATPGPATAPRWGSIRPSRRCRRSPRRRLRAEEGRAASGRCATATRGREGAGRLVSFMPTAGTTTTSSSSPRRAIAGKPETVVWRKGDNALPDHGSQVFPGRAADPRDGLADLVVGRGRAGGDADDPRAAQPAGRRSPRAWCRWAGGAPTGRRGPPRPRPRCGRRARRANAPARRGGRCCCCCSRPPPPSRRAAPRAARRPRPAAPGWRSRWCRRSGSAPSASDAVAAHHAAAHLLRDGERLPREHRGLVGDARPAPGHARSRSPARSPSRTAPAAAPTSPPRSMKSHTSRASSMSNTTR